MIAANAQLIRDGARHLANAVPEPAIVALHAVLACLPADRPGIRIHGLGELRAFLAPDGSIGRIATHVLGAAAQPVRALLFDKSPATNWGLPWHQDRAIAVAERIETDGFGPWTVKDGIVHVSPPDVLLAGMLTLRVHLDPVPPSNAPLLVAPGSHAHGRIAGRDIPSMVRRHGVRTCLAERGDVWLYATPILHASEPAREPKQRRVLQVDYAATELPGGLRWAGV